MVNKRIFGSTRGKQIPKADATNRAGGKAYQLSAKQALAQYAATGCFGNVYYASAETQLDELLEIVKGCAPEYVAKCAMYSRERGFMKDMPAFLTAYLTAVKAANNVRVGMSLAEKVFKRVIDNGKMLRNFVQIMRSDVLGRKSLGTAPRRMVRNWLDSKSCDYLFRATVGNDPSLADVIKMVHPKPRDAERAALYGYLTGRPQGGVLVEQTGDRKGYECKGWRVQDLPKLVLDYEDFKARREDGNVEVPDVPFQMLDALPLSTEQWTTIARHARWQMTRMNLNTFKRHGVLDDPETVQLLAERISSKEEVERARCFPYQLLVAYKSVASDMPIELKNALQDAMEHATANVPKIDGKVVVCPDTSGSMHGTPVTGARKGATSKALCVDVAGLVAACVLRQNQDARILGFDTRLFDMRPNPRDSVMTLARQIASVGGWGTNTSLPLHYMNEQKIEADLVVYVSDNESWADSQRGRGTAMLEQWRILKRRCLNAKLVCIDASPNRTTQVKSESDVLNVGGFSDAVFDLIASFHKNGSSADAWVEEIERIDLDEERSR